jgi:hypothetical protein
MACLATGGPNWWSQSMYVGMRLRKNRYGVWIVRHKLPKHLEGPIARVLNNGKGRQAYLQKTTRTKDKAEAKRIAVGVLTAFKKTLDEAEALLVERPLRTSLAQSDIDRIAEFYSSLRLRMMTRLRAKGVTTIWCVA